MLKNIKFLFIFVFLFNFSFCYLAQDLGLFINFFSRLDSLRLISNPFLNIKSNINKENIIGDINNILNNDLNFYFLKPLTDKDIAEIRANIDLNKKKFNDSELSFKLIDNFNKIKDLYLQIFNNVKNIENRFGKSYPETINKYKFIDNINNIILQADSLSLDNINLADFSNLDFKENIEYILNNLKNLKNNNLNLLINIQDQIFFILNKIKNLDLDRLKTLLISDIATEVNKKFLKRSEEYQSIIALIFIKKLNNYLQSEYRDLIAPQQDVIKELESYAISDYSLKNDFFYNLKLNSILETLESKEKVDFVQDIKIIKNIRDLYIKEFYKLADLYKNNKYIENSNKFLALDNLSSADKKNLKIIFNQELISQEYILSLINKNYKLITETIENSDLKENIKTIWLDNLKAKYNNILKSYSLKLRGSNFKSVIKGGKPADLKKQMRNRRKSMNFDEEEEYNPEEYSEIIVPGRSLNFLNQPAGNAQALREKMEQMAEKLNQQEESTQDNDEWDD